MNYTNEQMLDLIQRSRQRLSADQTRELVLAQDQVPREVYKDIKIKTQKHVSRDQREDLDTLTSSPLASASQEVSPEGLEGSLGQEEEVSVIAPATTSSRIHGITVQHVRTKSGVKLNIAIQTCADAETGEYVDLTAELKRHGRLRELKRYAGDDAYFEELYMDTIADLKALDPEQARPYCMGRMHVRGARGKWFANMFAVGKLNADNIIELVYLHVNGDEFEIALTGELSPRQAEIYHATGIWGSLRSNRPAPRLETAVRKTF